MRSARMRSLAMVSAVIGLSACQESGQPGPMGRAGAHVDRAVAGVQRSVGDFGVRAGRGIDQAGRSVGAAAQQAGTGLHDRLVPSDADGGQVPPPAPEKPIGY
jgi:hypothetical protein